MDEQPYDQYRQEAEILKEVGRLLPDPATTADLPTHLADAALASWQRDDALPLAEGETAEQQRVRADAACLALIGLAVENARAQGAPVALHPQTVGEAIAAANRDDEASELSRLLDEWDPIGVYDSTDDTPPPGEYARMVVPLLTKLRAGESPREISDYLTWDVRTNMGLPSRPGADIAAAGRIHAWFASRRD